MSSKNKIVPITQGNRRPKQGCFAVIVGSTRVEVSIDPHQPAKGPAEIIELDKRQPHTKQQRSRRRGKPTMNSAQGVSHERHVQD